jgi:hypothetical protein
LPCNSLIASAGSERLELHTSAHFQISVLDFDFSSSSLKSVVLLSLVSFILVRQPYTLTLNQTWMFSLLAHRHHPNFFFLAAPAAESVGSRDIPGRILLVYL